MFQAIQQMKDEPTVIIKTIKDKEPAEHLTALNMQLLFTFTIVFDFTPLGEDNLKDISLKPTQTRLND